MLRSLLHIAALLLIAGAVFAQDSKPLVERQTFIPVEELDVVVGRDQSGVLLSKSEFQKLYEAAKKNRDAQPKLPAAFATTDADYVAKIDGDHLVINATVRFQQFASGWIELPLNFGNLSVLNATVNDQPAKLGRRSVVVPTAAPNAPNQQAAPSKNVAAAPQPQLVLFHNQTGPATLKLELSTILDSVGGDKFARFEVMDAPAATLHVDIAANRTLKLFSRLLERPAPADQATTYHIPVGGQRTVGLLFTGNQTQQSTDSLTFASTGYGVRVAPGEIVWEAATRLQVFGTPLTTVQCVVPRSLEITDVTSTGLEAWTLEDNKDDPQSTLITLSYRQPIDAGRDISFKGVMSTPVGQSWAVPQIVIRKVTSHVGRCVVTHPAGVRLRLLEATGARAAVSTQAATLTFDLWRESFRLVLETQPHQREVMATTATLVDLNARGIDLFLTVSLETLFAPLFEADVRLPADWVVQSVLLDGQPIQWQSAAKEAGWNDLRINLPRPVQPGNGIGLTVQARRTTEQWPVDTEAVELKLPSFQLPQAATVEGSLVVKAEDDLEVGLDALTGLDPSATPTAGARSAFAYQNSEYEGTLKVSRRPSRMSAQTMTYSRLDREVWNSHLEATIDITGGGWRELQMKLPESVGNDIRFVVLEGNVGISEQVAADPENKTRLWTLRLDRRYRGTLKIGVDVSQPRLSEKNFSVPVLTLLQADRVNGFIGIEGSADQQLTIDAVDGAKKSLAEVDPIDLPLCHYQPQQRIVAGYRFMQPGYAVTLSEQRFDKLAVPTAICRSATYESVLSRTGELQHRAEYLFVAVTAQALTLTLPANEFGDPELWAVQLDGKPVEVRRRENAARRVTYLIPLARDKAADAERKLALFYRGQIDPLKTAQRWREQPPVLSVVQSEGSEQPLEILSQNWRVHYANDSMITASSGLFEPRSELDSQSLLGDLRQSFTGMSPMALFNSASYLFGATLLAVVIAALLRRHGVGKFGCAAALVAIPVVLVALLLPSVQSARSYKLGYVAMEAPKSAPLRGGTDQLYLAEADDGDGKGITNFDTTGKDDPLLGVEDKTEAAAPAAEEAMRPEKPAEPLVESKKEMAAAGEKKPEGDALPPAPDARPADGPAPNQADKATKDVAQKQQVADQMQDAAAQLADDKKADGRPARSRRSAAVARRPVAGKSGLLSLSLSLEVPANSMTKEFAYYGHQPVESGIGLDVQWQDRKGGDAWIWCLMTGFAMSAWLTLKIAPKWRGMVAALGITLPLGLVAVTPPACHIVLDGLFLGSLIASLLWGGRALLIYEIAWCKKNLIKQAAQTAALLCIALSASTANAQPAPNNTAAPAAVPVSPGPIVDSSKTIIVPVDDAKDPTKAERVLLSRDLFFQLWNLANPDKKVVAPASVDGLVLSARYDVQVRSKTEQLGAAALVKASLVLQNFREQQVVVTLPFDGIALVGATLNGQPAPLQVRNLNGHGLLDVVLDKFGTHRLELEFAIAAQEDGAVGQFTLPQFPASSGTVLFKLPQKTLQVRVNGSTSAYRRVEQNDDAFVAIPVGNNQPLTVAWRPPQQQAAVNAIINVDSTTGVLVDASGISHSTRMTIRVPQGTLADASFELPKGTLLQRISGPHLVGWEMAGDATARRVRVFFNPPISDVTDLQFQLFQEQLVGDEATALTLSAVRPLEVTRESGLIGVLATEDFSIRSQQDTGMRRVELSNLAPFEDLLQRQPKASGRLGFGFSTRPATAQVLVARQAAESVANSTHAVKVSRRKIQIASKLDLEFRRAARPSISLKLSDSYRPVEVQATAMADWFLTPGDGTNPRTLTIEFTQPLTGKAQIVMQGYVAKGPDDLGAEVVLPQPLEVATQTTSTAVWFDAAYAATVSQTDGWKLVGANVLPPILLQKQPTPPQFALTSSSLDLPPLAFDLVISQPRLAADSVVITTVTDTSIEYSLALKWKISSASADTFWFTTPVWLKDRLNVKGAGLRDVKSEEVEGSLRWTITLWDAVPSEYFALATATLPPAAKRVDVPDVRFLQPALDDSGSLGELGLLTTQRQFAMLVNQSQLQLRPTHADDVETVAPEDIPIVVNKELQQQAAEILRLRDGEKLPAWDVRKLEQQTGAPASVNLADLSIVLAADGTWRGQAEYTIRNRRRQFLAVRMPDKARLLSVFVKDEPSRAVQTRIALTAPGNASNESNTNAEKAGAEAATKIDVQLIPLPKSNASDLSFKVKLVYSGELPSRLPRGVFPLSLDVDLPAPDVITQQESFDYGIPVAKTVWHVFVPKGIDAMLIDDGVRTNVTPTDRGEVDAYIAGNLIRDGEQILSLFSGLSSSNESERRSQIRNNLKQQGLALHNVYQIEQQINSLSQSRATSSTEFEQTRRQFSEKLLQNRDNFAVVQQEQAANAYLGMSNGQMVPNGTVYWNRTSVDENNDAVLNYNSIGNLKQLGLANSEDINRNGVLDPGEDVNGNGALDMILGAATPQANQVDGTLVFDLEIRDGDVTKPTGDSKKGDAESKGKKAAEEAPSNKPQTSNRSAQREQSLSRLKALNDEVELKQQLLVLDNAPTQQSLNQATSNLGNNLQSMNGPVSGSGQMLPPVIGQPFRGNINGVPQTQLDSGAEFSRVAGPQNNFVLPGQTSAGLGGAPNVQLPNSTNPQFGRGLNYGGNALLGQQGQSGFGGGFANPQQVAQGPGGQASAQRNGEPAAQQQQAQLQGQLQQRFNQNEALRNDRAEAAWQTNVVAAPRAWSAVGGLSLNIDLPGQEQELIFSKVSGAPKLALKLRSREVVRTGFGVAWLLVWSAVGLTFTMLFLRSRWQSDSGKPVAWLLVAVGTIVFVVLPQPMSALGFLTFLGGLAMLAARYIRRAK